jgi:hypothetical protein
MTENRPNIREIYRGITTILIINRRVNLQVRTKKQNLIMDSHMKRKGQKP